MADIEIEAVLGWHRVCLNTIVRATKELESARLRILPMGSRVNVVEVCGRRVRIDQPIDGWCSIESSNGDLILSPTQADQPENHDGEEMQSPALDQDQQHLEHRADQLTKQLQELQWLRTEVSEAKHAKTEAEHAKKQLHQVQEQSHRQLLDATERITQLENEYKAVMSQLEDVNHIVMAKDKEVNSLKNQMNQTINTPNSEGQEFDNEQNNGIPSVNNSALSPLQNGNVVLMNSGDIVIVRYKGQIDFDDINGIEYDPSQEHIGVECSDPIGNSTGTVNGYSYFECNENFGMFLPTANVKKKIPAEFLLQKLHGLMKENERQRTAAE